MHFRFPAFAVASALLPLAFTAPVTSAPKGNLLLPRSNAMVTIINNSSSPRTFKIEASMSNPTGTYGSGNGEIPSINVPAGGTQDLPVGSGWSGAISDNDGEGTRFEFTMDGWNGMSWYNTDFQFGMSNAIVNPANGVKRADGGSPVTAGETNYLATAQAGWGELDAAHQQELLDTKYVDGTVGGALTSVHMDFNAPYCLVHFLQAVAKVCAYVNPGSIAGMPIEPDAARANQFSWSAQTNQFVITALN